MIEDTAGNKTKVVTWPDKSGYIRWPDGTGAEMLSTGTIVAVTGNIEILPDGSVVIVNIGGRMEITPGGITTSTELDGTTHTGYPAGPIRVIRKYKDGTTVTFRRDSTVFIQYSDGRTEEMSIKDYGMRHSHGPLPILFPNADPAPAITLPDTTKIIWFGDGKGVTIAPDGIVFPLYCPPGFNSIRLDCPPPIIPAIQYDDANQAGTPRVSADPVQKVAEKKPSSIYDNPFGFGGIIGGGIIFGGERGIGGGEGRDRRERDRDR